MKKIKLSFFAVAICAIASAFITKPGDVGGFVQGPEGGLIAKALGIQLGGQCLEPEDICEFNEDGSPYSGSDLGTWTYPER